MQLQMNEDCSCQGGGWWNPRSSSAIGDLPREEICTTSSQNTCKIIKLIARKKSEEEEKHENYHKNIQNIIGKELGEEKENYISS